MNSIISKTGLTVCLALVFVLTACSHTANVTKTNPALTPGMTKSDRYAQEIVRLNHVVRQNSESAGTKTAHLKLAKLYSDHNNRHRNYRKALEHLEAYVILEDSAADADTMNWMAALKEIDRLSKEITQVQKRLKKTDKAKLALKKTNRKLTREEIKLREKNRQLQESNQKLQKTIEMLKNLDQRLEEKRRNFNN